MNPVHDRTFAKREIDANNFDLQPLYTFFLAATSRTFTEAADRLCISQSAVSHAMAKLDRSLATRLWEKNGHSMCLTDSGKQLLKTCERVFSELQDLRVKLSKRNPRILSGLLNIGTTVEFGNSVLAKGLRPFIQKHPALDLGLTFSHNLLEPLLAGELDVIVDCWIHAREDLWRVPLFQERYILVAAPQLLQQTPVRHLRDLGSLTWLSLDKEGNWWHRFLSQIPAGIELNPPRFMLINHLRGMVHLAVTGAGIALIPAYCAIEELRQGSLQVLFPGRQIRHDRFSLYCKRSHREAPKVRAFFKFMRSFKFDDFEGLPRKKKKEKSIKI